MTDKLVIFGKNTWPFTKAARDDFKKADIDFEYYDILLNKNNLDIMLKYSGGTRKVPVIVSNGKVEIGYKGKCWNI